MFVKYMDNSDILARGFRPSKMSDLCPESFQLMDVSIDNPVDTLIHVWNNNNSYSYTICTDKESVVERGSFTRPEQLDELLTKYIGNATEEYRSRCLNSKNGVNNVRRED